MEYITHSLAETEELGCRLGRTLGPGAVDELFDIGWEDYLARGGVCAVEWSENVREALPPDAVTVTIARCPENDSWRSITIEGGEPL